MLANTKQIRAVINQAIAQNQGRVTSTYTDAPILSQPKLTTKRYVSYYMRRNTRATSLAILATAQNIAKNLGYTNTITCVNRNIRAVAVLA
jgi:hypothetical protein